MWASCNLGANNPTEAGDYFAWGETKTKNSFTENNYAYYNSDTMSYMEIGKDIAGTEYDAANVNLGGGWRMPNYSQMEELKRKCSWNWTKINGVLGYEVTGPNGNSIFLPKVGNKGEYSEHYWSSTQSDLKEAYNGWFSSSQISWPGLGFTDSKSFGRVIRPVISYDDYNGVTDFDDSAVTALVTAYYGGGSIMSNGNTILSGSKLNFYFKNGSSEPVTLTNIKLIDGNGTEGGNLLDSDAIVTAGDTQGYTITLSRNTISPKCRFTYRYNNHVYSVEAAYQSFNWTKSFMHELKAE